MLKQITLQEALRLVEAGERVRCIRGADDWRTSTPCLLNDLLEDIVMFADMGDVQTPEPAKPASKFLKPIDWGKVWALRDTGWTWKQIAQDLGVSEAHIYAHKEDAEAKEAFAQYQKTKGGKLNEAVSS